MKKPFEILKNLDLYIAMFCLAVLIVITFVGVFMRYFFSSPILWQEEMQMALIVWTVFLGGSVAFRTSSQVAMEIFIDALPPRPRRVAELCICMVVTVVLAFVGVKGAELVQQFANTSRVTNILHIPAQYIYFIIPVGCMLMIINNVAATWHRFVSADAEQAGEGRR